VARAFTITALIATYNEEDVVGVVLADLVSQGIRVHLLDQGSTDGTVAEARRFGASGLIEIESIEGEGFSLARIIRRKELLAARIDSDWFINADADEFRESPWPGIGLAEGIERVDRLGWNAIDFAVLSFPPVHDAFRMGDDPRESFRFYEPAADFDRRQIRCWKKPAGPLDLVSTAGHEARFAERRVFPLRFLLRHYPIRGQAHGERKVWKERVPRFDADERARGWHVQYDAARPGASFLREPSSLTPYEPWRVRLELALRHRGVERLEAEVASGRQELACEREAGATLARALQQEADALRRERDELSREKSRLQAALAQRGAEVASLRLEIASLAESSERTAGCLRARLDAVLGSRIWRWTRPLRSLLDRLGGA
jgi:hypothetical protein